MRFSIITCTYNSVATLADTIQSVHQQIFVDYEHIFVDGGSKDGTLELICELAPTAKVLHDIGGGISAAMNAGLLAAKGEYVAHLHSDDMYADPRTLDWVDQAIKQSKAGWIIGDFNYLTDKGIIPGSVVAPLTLRKLGYGNYIPHFSTFVKRTLFLEVGGFDEHLKFCMDYDLWFKLFARSRPYHVPHVLATFRAHDGSVSTSNRRKVLIEELKVRSRYFNRAPGSIPRYLIRFLKRWKKNRLV